MDETYGITYMCSSRWEKKTLSPVGVVETPISWWVLDKSSEVHAHKWSIAHLSTTATYILQILHGHQRLIIEI